MSSRVERAASDAAASSDPATVAPPERTFRFGEGAILTPANLITIARLLLAIPTVLLIAEEGSSWLTLSLWFVLACTDRLDGWLARRDGTTRSGAFLDPLADKFLVIGGFAALGVRGDFSWLAVTIVAVREVGISMYRSYAARRGISLPAQNWGKGKAFAQFLAVGAVLLPWTYDWATVHDIILWIAVALTLVSGLEILRAGWRLQREQKRLRAASASERPDASVAERQGGDVRVDVLAIGTELLLGQIVDTNSSWIGEHLAAAGIDTCEHRKVGDNLARMVQCLEELLDRADAVIVCGGLGPTPDDVTREAIAEVMGVELERREDLIDDIRRIFGGRGRPMPENNLRQADVPKGGGVIPNPIGTAPGLQCEVDVGGATKVVYAVPGVPYEMTQMIDQHVLPDLLERSGERAVIVSRSLKTWGASESGLAEMIAERVDQQTNPTIAFLARGIEGIYVRMTAKAPTEAEARELLDAEDRELREVLGDLVFAVDDDTMESTVLSLCEARGWSLGVAESLTGGFIGGRIANVPGASRTYRGSIASYATEVKRAVLGVTSDAVVSEDAAREMAEAAQRVLGADVGVSATGVAGPDEMDDQPVGTVFYGIAIPGVPTEVVAARLPGDRERIRQFSTISVLNLLRMRLLGLP